MMMNTDIAAKAIADNELWETIRLHRESFTHMNGVDYTPDIRKRICLVPPTSLINVWKQDYNDMRTAMIYGDTPTFDVLIEQMRKLEKMFRTYFT